jgi:uncharacterized protein (TIGR02996 family)
MLIDEVFRQAILEEPDNDFHRVVYADWLDEERSEYDRAEYIREEIQQAKIDRRFPGWTERTRPRVPLFGSSWGQEVLGLGPRAYFSRGLVEWVKVTAEMFLQNVESWLDRTPLRYVWLTDVIPWLDQVLRCPHLARFPELDLAENPLHVWDVEALARCPHLGNPLSLDLRETGVTDEAMQVLAGSPNLRNLTHLRGGENAVGDVGLRALLMSPHLPRLEGLYLPFNSVTASGLLAAARTRNIRRLRELDLAYNPSAISAPPRWAGSSAAAPT